MQTDEVSQKKELLGTLIEIKLPRQFSHLFSDCFSELERIEKTYSRFLKDSLLSQLNKSLGKWHTVPDEFVHLLTEANRLKKITDGNFDISLKSVLDSMGYDAQYSFKPKEVKNGIMRRIAEKILAPYIIKGNEVLLRKEIEFGGFGKGFALDRVRQLLDSKGVSRYYINAGGDIYAKGNDWKIFLEHPDPDKILGELLLDGKALTGSSPSKRKWGKYHHLINAKTLKPANDVRIVFILAEKGIDADAYATALFTAKFEEAIAISRKNHIACLIVSAKNKMFISEDFPVKLYD
ncbi:MAG TPA: FAD:protein FMN transferase [Candidatus Nanoarchaeia archaeon]|nr:FAD:protein FMN transferase [Candidatus Nanoarchaeia archaeon]